MNPTELEELRKRRTELENELQSMEKQEKTLNDKIKALESAGITVARNLGKLGETALEVMGQA